MVFLKHFYFFLSIVRQLIDRFLQMLNLLSIVLISLLLVVGLLNRLQLFLYLPVGIVFLLNDLFEFVGDGEIGVA